VEGIRVGRLDATNRRCAVSSAARVSAALNRLCGCLASETATGPHSVHELSTRLVLDGLHTAVGIDRKVLGAAPCSSHRLGLFASVTSGVLAFIEEARGSTGHGGGCAPIAADAVHASSRYR
jgi:hypothetical protein